MTSRERLTRICRGGVPDRPAVRLVSARPGQELLHPAYAPVRDLAAAKTDLMLSAGARFDLLWGARKPDIREEERPADSAEWIDRVTHVETPAGGLRSVYRASTCGQVGYQVEPLVKEPTDLAKLLSVPYVPYPFDAFEYQATEDALGDRGITLFRLDHAMYGLQRQIGSEKFAIWSLDHRHDLHEIMAEYARRIMDHVKAALTAGIRGAFTWVGPELCIPPLMSVADFDDFVARYDTPIIDAIHEAGGRVRVHCHGKMGPVLERLAEMGVDVLHPVEPPPMGDITLEEAFQRVGDGMALEGNIETHDLMTLPADHLRDQVIRALETGRGRRFILCPCSGYMEDPNPTPRHIENLLIYINEGVRHAAEMAPRPT